MDKAGDGQAREIGQAREWAGPGDRPGPCMYEMQGPGPVFGRWPAGCPAGFWLIDRLLVPGTRVKFRFPGSSCVPGLPPAWFPSPAVTYFYCPEPRRHKGFRALISILFRCPQGIHNDGHVVPRSRHFSTRPSTTSSTGESGSASPVLHRRARSSTGESGAPPASPVPGRPNPARGPVDPPADYASGS
jgi:hypothetical protein